MTSQPPVSYTHLDVYKRQNPGSGSDPSMMRTTATRQGDKWLIHGRKWFITGAGAAQHFILIARTSDDARKGLSAFLFDADQPLSLIHI